MYLSELEAVIEIGSTGIRLMAFEITEKAKWNVIDKSEFPVPLGHDVFTTGYVSRDTILQMLHILNRFKEQLQGWAITENHTHLIATSVCHHILGSLMPRHKGREESEDDVAEDLRNLPRWSCTLLYELVDARPAILGNREYGNLYGDNDCRIYLSAYVGGMDKPYVQAQPYGRCLQCSQRELYAGDTTDGERVFGKSAYEVCLSRQGMGRLDKCRESVPSNYRIRYARFGKVVCGSQ